MKQFHPQKQSGFTLIELIVVMVILGVLAATALPKFVDLGGDARAAALNGVKGSLNSTNALVHGKWLAGGVSVTKVTADGTEVDVDTAGYMKVSDHADVAAISGISSTDFTIIPPGTAADDDNPLTSDDEIAFVPIGLKDTKKGAKCYVKYNNKADDTTAPVISIDTSVC